MRLKKSRFYPFTVYLYYGADNEDRLDEGEYYNDPQKLDHVLRWIGGPTASMWR